MCASRQFRSLFRLAAIFLPAIPTLNACVDEQIDCLSRSQSSAYFFVPTPTDPTKCEALTKKIGTNLSASEHMELTKCHVGGKGVVASDLSKDRQEVSIVEAEQMDDHMVNNTGVLATAGGGTHDDLVKDAPVSLAAVPDHLKDKWVTLGRGVKTGPNGCGIFATAVCNRILGREANPLITQDDWDKTYADLGSFHGITPFSYVALYYQKRGYCSETKPLKGLWPPGKGCPDYTEIKQKLAAGCDVKLFFARKSSAWFNPSSNPHIETVVDASDGPGDDNCFLHTNSWNHHAKVSGGSCSTFFHEKNRDMGGGSFAWPPNDARVWVQSTCECEDLQPHLNYLDEVVATIKPAS